MGRVTSGLSANVLNLSDIIELEGGCPAFPVAVPVVFLFGRRPLVHSMICLAHSLLYDSSYLARFYSRLGLYYWSVKNDLEAAKPYYQKVYELDPNDENAKRALGIGQEVTE